MATPATAAFLQTVTSEAELKQAVRFSKQRGLAVLPLGAGSNTVFTRDYPGLILQLGLRGIELRHEDQHHVRLHIAAGENWHDLVTTTLENGWFGLENLALIPGLVGAAPIQNIGAYGAELAGFVTQVDVLDLETLTARTLSAKECEFAYRDSVFKRSLQDKVVITAVELKLGKQANVNLSYRALRDYFPHDHPSPTQVYDAVCEIRSAKLPLPSQVPNCGSFFKNPVISADTFARLEQRFPSIVGYPEGERVKLAAAWLIEQAGWKDRAHDGVKVHQHQALVITNPHQSSGEAVAEYAQMIREDILDKYGIRLEIEPQMI